LAAAAAAALRFALLAFEAIGPRSKERERRHRKSRKTKGLPDSTNDTRSSSLDSGGMQKNK
jgi:hypothetical protein